MLVYDHKLALGFLSCRLTLKAISTDCSLSLFKSFSLANFKKFYIR